ncbi:MAG: hypothetical protein ABUR63_03925 [Verrucomicrobiota bacterium]
MAAARARADWNVLPHRAIDRLAENVWRVSGTLPRMSLRRTMTVVRRADGGLIIYSAIALDDRAMRDIEAWGRPAYLLIPNGFHRLDAAAYKTRYPNLVVLAPRGSRAKVEQVLAVDGTFDDLPPDGSARAERLAGVGDLEGVLVVTSADGVTIILSDIVFNMDRKRDPMGFIITTLFGSAPGPRISRLARATLVKDRDALRADLARLADTPRLVRLIVSHEKVATGEDAPAALRKAATYL